MAGTIIVVILALGFFLPALLAFTRGHHYRWIILALNVFGFTGICWLIAMAWAVWPTEKSLADPVLGNVTGLGDRNAGDTRGAMDFGRARGFDREASAASNLSGTAAIMSLERLAALHDLGALTDEEFRVQKARVLGQRPNPSGV